MQLNIRKTLILFLYINIQRYIFFSSKDDEKINKKICDWAIVFDSIT